MTDYTVIADSQVDPNAPITSELMTALRDNPIAIAEGSLGAPTIIGTPYDYQEFIASGTWTKPANAATGDKVIVQVVAGGESGSSADGGTTSIGGSGGQGAIKVFDDIDDLPSSGPVTVGAGGAGKTTVGVNAGGASQFLGSATEGCIVCSGGSTTLRSQGVTITAFGDQGSGVSGDNGNPAEYGGGAGGGSISNTIKNGAASRFAGSGGQSNISGTGQSGTFPGGGGGGTRLGTSGAGANGVVRVWCVRERT